MSAPPACLVNDPPSSRDRPQHSLPSNLYLHPGGGGLFDGWHLASGTDPPPPPHPPPLPGPKHGSANAGRAITPTTATINRQAMRIANVRFTLFTSLALFPKEQFHLALKTGTATLEA